ncbi:SDR family NAD(P)-dependent oxidoreductase, partial [Burkholderia sp. Ac-20379]|uniref:SDR family NAD(P)-dependent oxidoreductase n=1 Tax=Burkholderia sp. Ac-20379 TaxID=2703900 RepID=UPI0019810025
GGGYLITGGLGALGRLTAEHIARQAPGATVVLAGASELDAPRRDWLGALDRSGIHARYLRADLGDEAAAVALVRTTIALHGALHGVIHCAGIHRDSAIVRKRADELHAVLAPKVTGAAALERACRGMALDCFVLFSSLGGAFGNPGQADYAAANGFLDALAEQSATPMVSINWPLWRDGGMRVPASVEQAFFERMGQRPLDTDAAMAALDAVLAAGVRRAAVIAGDRPRIQRFFETAPRHR